jgi:integrase
VPSFIEIIRAAAAGEPTKLAFEFLILTAARTSEVIGAKWDEIDLDAKTWTVPASRIKAGREHRVPLSPRCIELLNQAKSISGDGQFVFPGRLLTKPMSNTVFLMFLRRVKRDDITGHGFRSAFRDWAAEKTSFSRSVCEAALAHVVENKTEAAYFRSDLFERRRDLMNTWSAFVATQSATVIPIRA